MYIYLQYVHTCLQLHGLGFACLLFSTHYKLLKTFFHFSVADFGDYRNFISCTYGLK